MGEAHGQPHDQRAAVVLLGHRRLAARREQALLRLFQPRHVDRRRQDVPDEQPAHPSRLPRALDRPEGPGPDHPGPGRRRAHLDRRRQVVAPVREPAARAVLPGGHRRRHARTRSAAGSRTTTAGAARPTRSRAAASAAPDWYVVTGGDGEWVVPAPSDPNIIYADSQNGNISRFDRKTQLSRNIRPYLSGASEMAPADLKYRFNWTLADRRLGDRRQRGLRRRQRRLQVHRRRRCTGRPISPDLTRNDKSKQKASGGPGAPRHSRAPRPTTRCSRSRSRRSTRR